MPFHLYCMCGNRLVVEGERERAIVTGSSVLVSTFPIVSRQSVRVREQGETRERL